MTDKDSSGFHIDFDLPAMKKAQLRHIRIHLVISCISWAVFVILRLFERTGIISFALGCLSAVMFIAGLIIYCSSAKKCAVDDVTITDDSIDIDEDHYSLADPDINIKIENGLKFDPGNLAGCYLVVKDMKNQTKKHYWIGPKRHFDTMYKRDLLMDEILLRQSDNIEDKVPTTVRFPNLSMTVIGLGLPIMMIIVGVFFTVTGFLMLERYGLMIDLMYDLHSGIMLGIGCVIYTRTYSPIISILLGIGLISAGVIWLLRNIANLTSMPQTVTVSDKGIDIDGAFFDYESYPDIRWDRKSYGSEIPMFDFYLSIAGRRYWTGNSFMDGAASASEEIRKAVIRLDPYERERRTNGRR